jgi:ATP-dependent DNA helicase RecQ
MPSYRLKGNIPPGLQAQPGKALCIWRDAGWGGLAWQGKIRDRRFADDLVEACARLVREWDPKPRPTWVTCVPSLRYPDLVPDFARRLAAALHRPFHKVITKIEERPEQRTMANSTQQGHNIDGAFAIGAEPLPAGSVLLVDDLVDSRWTLTVAAWLLRSHGSGEVWPLALALTGYEK